MQVMHKHQRYFPVEDCETGKLLPAFIAVYSFSLYLTLESYMYRQWDSLVLAIFCHIYFGLFSKTRQHLDVASLSLSLDLIGHLAL